MEPCRRYTPTGKVHGSPSKIHENIVITRISGTLIARNSNVVPQNGAFLMYNYATRGFIEALEFIIETNMFYFYTSLRQNLEKTVDFIVKSNVNLSVLPMFVDVFPDYNQPTHPATFDLYSMRQPVRNGEIEFLFPRIFVGQEIKIGGKVRLITKLSSNESTDVEVFGGRKTRQIILVNDEIQLLRVELGRLKSQADTIDRDIEKAFNEMMENSRTLELSIERVNDKKLELNEEFHLLRKKLEAKWEKVYRDYVQRRQEKLAKIDDELAATDDVDTQIRLKKLRLKLVKQIEDGHSKEKHQRQIEELDEKMKQRLSELDESVDQDSVALFELSNAMNSKIEKLQLEKEESRPRLVEVFERLRELELTKEKLITEIELEKSQFFE